MRFYDLLNFRLDDHFNFEKFEKEVKSGTSKTVNNLNLISFEMPKTLKLFILFVCHLFDAKFMSYYCHRFVKFIILVVNILIH